MSSFLWKPSKAAFFPLGRGGAAPSGFANAASKLWANHSRSGGGSNTKQHYTPRPWITLWKYLWKIHIFDLSYRVWVCKVQEMLNQRRGLFPQTIEEIERWGIFTFKMFLMDKCLTNASGKLNQPSGGTSQLWILATWYIGRFSWPPPSNHAQQTCMVGILNCENRFWTCWNMAKFHGCRMNFCRKFVSGVFGGLWIGPAMQTTSLWPCQRLKKRNDRKLPMTQCRRHESLNLSDMSDHVRRCPMCRDVLRSSMKNALTNGWEGVRTAPFARRPGKIHREAAFHALHYALHDALLFMIHTIHSTSPKCPMPRLGRQTWIEPYETTELSPQPFVR